jgi:hypothetical protein
MVNIAVQRCTAAEFGPLQCGQKDGGCRTKKGRSR